ncbi:hypothetical protein CQY20_18125 [Mycolicibacterium agri]|uniref:Secreted protein n=1 Tax=Mycolicibacterium agri TaxID=36811 RepID=A0A2A7MYU6_MYCAG|nr:hypothetical protein [Mycolicibacterium agri]PEG36677.1 hypothetical protein CQY20_18125 [Mycolicibacterium agri]GFG49145.1 hypothetical protein MAGR_05860 [Mycolicibacterium agri]
MRRAVIVAAVAFVGLSVAQSAAAEPPHDHNDIREYPLAQGNYTTDTDYAHKFFKTPDGRHCGIGPNGGPVGCDAVPTDAPPGTNQVVVNSWGPAEYRHSDTPSFTRDVDVLPEGCRLENWGATCAVEHQGTVHCETYDDHGFVVAATYGELW